VEGIDFPMGTEENGVGQCIGSSKMNNKLGWLCLQQRAGNNVTYSCCAQPDEQTPHSEERGPHAVRDSVKAREPK